MTTTPLAIGSTVWRFDINHRVYRGPTRSVSVGGPIYREHFRPVEIVGETSRSWLVGYGKTKIPKANDGRECNGFFLTQEAVNDAVFREDHAYRISEAVGQCADVIVLKQIAALVGYEAKP